LFFFLIKRTKNQVSKEASLRSWPLPGSSGKTTGCKVFAPLRTLLPRASAKNCYAPPNAQGPPVLPALTRSFFADGFVNTTLASYD
jgi:hypothetical protein